MASKVVIDANPWPKIGVVGCGTIAAAVVEGLCRLGQNPPEKINCALEVQRKRRS